MAIPPRSVATAAALRADVDRARGGAKRLRLRTLLAKFGYTKRSDGNTAEITRQLNAVGLAINPPIVRLGEAWEISSDAWIYLAADAVGDHPDRTATPPLDWDADGWFAQIATTALRTEKEVEIKFIVPLLTRLGYTDDDRYDGMPVPAAFGSRDTTLVIDFALFNNDHDALRNQPLLTVEAKRENRLVKQRELLSAHNQAKSYCLWTQCDFFLVTDSQSVLAFHVARGRMGDLAPLFSCDRGELPQLFPELYALLSKETLTRHYLRKLTTREEAG